MTRHETPQTGLWVARHNFDPIDKDGYYDTRAEAIEAYDLDEGEVPYYVGQITCMTDEDIADAFLRRPEDANGHLAIQDEWTWRENDCFSPPSQEQTAELRRLVIEWVARCKLNDFIWNADLRRADLSDRC